MAYRVNSFQELAQAEQLPAPNAARVEAALRAWVVDRAVVPADDARVKALVAELPALVSDLSLRLDVETGLRVLVAARSSSAAARLREGATWLRSGDWWEQALAAW